MYKDKEWVTPDGKEAHLSYNPQDNIGIIAQTVWKKYRFSFEESWLLTCGLARFSDPEPAEKYFVEVVEEEDASETESEELGTDKTRVQRLRKWNTGTLVRHLSTCLTACRVDY
ncbi:hypothetical protein GMOD_00009619 [Pyrenophora seminiperda CCB06]|uniref:Uncharacterized protein n=1 Tax=Pyrenophora seminiperda CCB06 TaxID=1302712 RepID=A0A3M7MF38_9PLEO|nr:hypothetical protein GMOD_00009619 [Pyrenophora seminiperda CCB06]